MTEQASGVQRSYRAQCPGCGASVEFRSAQSVFAVCSYCQTTIERDGDTLRDLGKIAALFEDFSPLQLGASGAVEKRPFTIVGRLQYAYEMGFWTEWIAAFEDGSPSAVISEDNGAYVLMQPYQGGGAIALPEQFPLGSVTKWGQVSFTVSANQMCKLASAQGELTRLPALGRDFAMAELRSEDGQLISLDWSSPGGSVFVGRSVRLADLQLKGLREESVEEQHGRALDCPHCGAALSVKLMKSLSVTCNACGSVIDISSGDKAAYSSFVQDMGQGLDASGALGSVGALGGQSWQVVGFQRRSGHNLEETFDWDEYLLYNRQEGFSFLVCDSLGWSLVNVITAAPSLSATGGNALYQGKSFHLESSYTARTNFVMGEFYWRVQVGQTSQNLDYSHAIESLSLEISKHEQVWSWGQRLSSNAVLQAFPHLGLMAKEPSPGQPAVHEDASPVSGMHIGNWIWIVLAILVLYALSQMLPNNGSYNDAGPYYGGGYGGYSSGGGHK